MVLQPVLGPQICPIADPLTRKLHLAQSLSSMDDHNNVWTATSTRTDFTSACKFTHLAKYASNKMEIPSMGYKIKWGGGEQHRCELHIADHTVQKREAEKHSQNTLEKIHVGKS
jgi:hypothetical protein